MFLSAREAGGEARRGGSWAAVQQAIDLRPDAFPTAHDVVRSEAYYAPTLLLHEECSAGVGFDLERVMIAVDLNDELFRNAREVRKVRANRVLSAEFYAVHSVRT